MEFSEKDIGIGIPQNISAGFLKDSSGLIRAREVGGDGLWPFIVKHMAELQQAKYGVESVINRGGRFWVKFRKVNKYLSV